jgi:hypothetical protein
MQASTGKKGTRTAGQKPSLTLQDVEPYLNDLIDLVLPGLSAASKGRKAASRRSKK